jgi:putative ABC transport system permease protein
VQVLSTVALVGGVFVFALIQTREWLPAVIFTVGLGVLVLALSGAALMVSRLAVKVPRSGLGFTLRHGVAALARPGAGVIGAAVALGLGTLVVLALGIVGSRLEEELVNGAPPDAPTVFLVDVQPDQWDGVQEIMTSEGMTNVDSTPVVMARLSAVAGTPVHELIDDERRGRERWTLTREQRLTWADELPGGNTLVGGELWTDPDVAELSIEAGFAESLGVGLGDTVSFDVQGLPMTFTITSLREVDWASFRINFFLLVEPGVMEGAPGWRLAAGRIAPEREGALQASVVERYPNISVLRIRPLLEKIAGTLGRIALAVRLLGGFTVLVGIAILAGAVAATSLKRGGEAALLKSMGLTRRGVASLFAVEYGLLGLVAGAFGGLGALLLSWAFLRFGLQLPGLPSLASVPLAAIGTAVLAVVAGLAASAKPLRASPIETLRG